MLKRKSVCFNAGCLSTVFSGGDGHDICAGLVLSSESIRNFFSCLIISARIPVALLVSLHYYTVFMCVCACVYIYRYRYRFFDTLLSQFNSLFHHLQSVVMKCAVLI